VTPQDVFDAFEHLRCFGFGNKLEHLVVGENATLAVTDVQRPPVLEFVNLHLVSEVSGELFAVTRRALKADVRVRYKHVGAPPEKWLPP
jgi:hypothetical protein